jgi:hypothetical protein
MPYILLLAIKSHGGLHIAAVRAPSAFQRGEPSRPYPCFSSIPLPNPISKRLAAMIPHVSIPVVIGGRATRDHAPAEAAGGTLSFLRRAVTRLVAER